MTRALLAERLRTTSYVWLPCLVVIILAAPSIDFMLPAYYSHLGENYQPLKALRFFHAFGADFHKYGPVSNFLLAPGYALSMGYWWLTGSFAHPSGDFPYGLQQPLEQISFLLRQGRALFLLIFVGLSAVWIVSLRAITSNRLAIALAFLFCVGTNYAVVGFAANTRPDGPMFAFVGASLGVYALIVYDGLTLRRSMWLSLLAVCAISSKEIAGPTYVLPYLGLGWVGWRDSQDDPAQRRDFLRTATASVATGVACYLLINVVYAPAIWLERMSHWLAGEGADSAVWGGVGSGEMGVGGFIVLLLESFLNTLGPGGTVIVVLSLLALVRARPPHWLLVLLPFASMFGIGLAPLGYGADRLTAVATVTLVPPVAAGLAVIFVSVGPDWRRPALGSLLAAALTLNLLFATFTWHRLEGLFPRAMERTLEADPPEDATIAYPQPHEHISGKSRMAWLGYRVDTRSLQQVMDAAPSDRPDRIYISAGQRGFLDDAREQAARAAMLAGDGLDVGQWQGFEALSYRLAASVPARTPAWFFFDWMPAVDLWSRLSVVEVYQLGADGAPAS